MPAQRGVDELASEIRLPAAGNGSLRQLPPLTETVKVSAEELASQAAPEADEVAHVYREGRPSRMYVAPEVFAERYAGATLDQLRSAKGAVEARSHDLAAKAGHAFLDAGRGAYELTPRAESLDHVPTPPAEEDDGLIRTQRTHVTASGELAVEKGKLPWEEYQSVYDVQDELFWLTGEIRRRERETAASGASVPKAK